MFILKSTLLTATLGLAALAFSIPSLRAQDSSYNPNDVLLFLQNPNGTVGTDKVVYYSLGSAVNVFRDATGNAVTPLGNINSILVQTFGADWTNKTSTIFTGAAGQNGATSALSTAISANGDYARTVYVTKARTSVGTVGQANSASPVFDPAQTAVAGMIDGSNDISGMTQPGVVSISDTLIDGYNSFSNGNPSTAYGAIAGGIQNNIGNTTVTFGSVSNVVTALDLYRVTKTTGPNASSNSVWHVANNKTASFSKTDYPGNNGARADFLGTITLSSDGSVNFSASSTGSTPTPTPTPSPSPEPSPSPSPEPSPSPSPSQNLPTVTLASQQVFNNQAVTLTAEAVNAESFRWLFKGKPIAKATTRTYSFTASAKTVGQYSVIASNSFGNATASASVTIRAAAEVTPTGLLNRTYNLGDSANFGFDPASYVGPEGERFYQWIFNGKLIKNATNDSLAISNIDYTKAGVYSLQIKNSAGKTNVASWVVSLEQSGVLVYTLKGNGISTNGPLESKKSVSGFLIMDEENQNAALIMFGGKPGVNGYNQLTQRTEIAAHSTGPVNGSRTVYTGSVVRDLDEVDDNGTEEIEMLWVSGLDSVIQLSKTSQERVTAPKTLKGFMTMLTLDDNLIPSLEEYSIQLKLDTKNTLTAITETETMETTVSRIRDFLDNKGFTSTDEN